MKICILKVPLAKKERVSLKAAKFALMLDRLDRFPAASKHFDRLLFFAETAVKVLEVAEKTHSPEDFQKMVDANFPALK